MIKKFIFSVAMLVVASLAQAQVANSLNSGTTSAGGTAPAEGKETQRSDTFEGEICYETFENYSDYLLKMGNSIIFNGVHKMRLILKGSKMHLIDETTKCHTIGNVDFKSIVHFCDYTKTGMDFSKNLESQLTLAPRDIIVSKSTCKLTSNTFEKKDKFTTLLNHDCQLFEGEMQRTMGGMNQKYTVKSYVANDIKMPVSYPYAIYGLETPGAALRWSFKYDGGHISLMKVGELSFYIEADVTSITPRSVSDQEFAIPADYKISKGAMNAFALMKYYSGVRKQLEKLGIKGGDNSQKKSGVHYKTDGEWDY